MSNEHNNAPAVPEALTKWANSPELVETGNQWQQGYEYARAWVHVQLTCSSTPPAPAKDRCNTCGEAAPSLADELESALEALVDRCNNDHQYLANDEAVIHAEAVLEQVYKSRTTTPSQEQVRALAICVESRRVSISEVQRKLQISFNEANDLCQSLVDAGYATGLALAPSLRATPAPAPSRSCPEACKSPEKCCNFGCQREAPAPAQEVDEAQIQKLRENGAKAWAGVDAQQLRAGFAAPSQEPSACGLCQGSGVLSPTQKCICQYGGKEPANGSNQ